MKNKKCYLWILFFFLSVSLQAEILFTLGNNDGSDQDFAQTNYRLNFYPDSESSALCPKELNLYNHTTQYFHFALNSQQVSSDIMIELDAAWSSSVGLLEIAIEKWNHSDWIRVDTTLVNQKDSGFVEIPRGFLQEGTNSFRLKAISGTGGTNVVTWDQIQAYTVDQNILFSIGQNDSSEAEFSSGPFSYVWSSSSDSSQFPKELNTSWWPTQYIHFDLTSSESERSAYFSFDVHWNNGNGTLNVALDYWNGSNWEESNSISISKVENHRMEIPAQHLKEGLNEIRLRAVYGTNGTSVVVWDQLTLWQRSSMPNPMKELLETIVDTTLNYWLADEVIHQSGLPLTAYQSGDRARFGYSNPTEWGYALQAIILAADFGKITSEQASQKLQTTLNTLLTLQSDPNQFSHGLFYPYYTLVDDNGIDNEAPVNDGDSRLPSGDCALLWGSLWVVEGWLQSQGLAELVLLNRSVRNNMDFRSCFFTNDQGASIAHQIDAHSGVLSDSRWNIFSDEGGVVNFISYLSDSISSDEFSAVHENQSQQSASWNGHTVERAGFFNSGFVWPQRMFIGYPLNGGLENRQFMEHSFIPNMKAHLDWTSAMNIDHMGFSDSMTQTYLGIAMVGQFVPPNLQGIDETNNPYILSHVQPHGTLIPFSSYGMIEMDILKQIYEHVLLIKNDTQGYWHDNNDLLPYGFEVTVSPYQDIAVYSGADDGRNIFESLSQAYTLFSAAYALQIENDMNTFSDYASFVQDNDYETKLDASLDITYPNPKD